MSRNLLENPLKSLKGSDSFIIAKELSKLSFDTVLWEKLDQSAIGNAINQMVEDLADYYQKASSYCRQQNNAYRNGLTGCV